MCFQRSPDHRICTSSGVADGYKVLQLLSLSEGALATFTMAAGKSLRSSHSSYNFHGHDLTNIVRVMSNFTCRQLGLSNSQ
jgi:hypothetical protein